MTKKLTRILCILLSTIVFFALTSCGSSSDSKDKTSSAAVSSTGEKQKEIKGTFKVWWYEKDGAMDKSWNDALNDLKAKYPKLKVVFEQKSFDQIQQTAQMVLNSNDCPDVMECNKGNATAGQYAKQGLLQDLTDAAAQYGWDKILSPSIMTTCKYDENGIMGSGKLFGVTTYGEFVMVYYNKDLFKKYNIQVPTTYDEFVKVMDTLKKAGVTPLALGDQDKWPASHNWYELALYKANRDFITNYQLMTKSVDFNGPEFTFASTTFADWSKKGYFEPNAIGTKYDDINAAFQQGKYPMTLTGSWMFGTFKTGMKADWGIFVLPGKNLNTGSGGNLFVVPKNAKNKDAAYEFINLSLQKKAQTVMANTGGLPINPDSSLVTDPAVKELNDTFSKLVANDELAFYPDWPAPQLMDTEGAGLQNLLSGKWLPKQFNDSVAKTYNDYKNSK